MTPNVKRKRRSYAKVTYDRHDDGEKCIEGHKKWLEQEAETE